MTEIIPCPSCGRKLQLPHEHLGATVQCRSCGRHFVASLDEARPRPSPAVREKPVPAPAEPLLAEEPAPAIQSPELPVTGRKTAWVVGGGVLLIFGLIFVLGLRNPFRRDPFVGWQGEDRPPLVVQGLPNQKPLSTEEIAEQIKPLFQELGAALKKEDAARVASHFDADRMIDEFIAQDLLPADFVRNRHELTGQLQRNLAPSFQRNTNLRWDDSEIRDVKKLEGADPGFNEATVIVRHRHPEGFFLRIRWWVTKRQGTWRLYDLEDLDTGLRTSSLPGTLKEVAAGQAHEVTRALPLLGQAIADVTVHNDPVGADQKLAQIAEVKLPRKIDAARHMITARLRAEQGRNEEALRHADQALELNPEMHVLNLIRGIAFNNQKQWDKALEHLKTYETLLGEDAPVCSQIGIALQEKRQFPEAAKYYRKSLDFAPRQPDVFFNMMRSLAPGDQKDDLGARFAKLDHPHRHFVEFAEDCRQALDGAALEQISSAMVKIDSEYAPAYYYQALGKVWARHFDQAFVAYRAALAKEKEPGKPEEYRQGFLREMALAGQVRKAYEAEPDSRAAFERMATELKRGHRLEELADLVELHEKKDPGDTLLTLFRAEIEVHDGDYARAEKSFVKALAERRGLPMLADFRSSRVLAKFHTGQALAALTDIGPRRETFLQLVGLCQMHNDLPLLHKILADQEMHDPDDADLAVQKVRLHLRQKEPAKGAAVFKDAVARQRGDEQRKRLLSDFLHAMVDAGYAQQAYDALPDVKDGFETLANDLLDQNKTKELAALLEAHRRRHPDEPLLLYYQAEMHLEEQAWEKAARVLDEGRKKAAEPLRARMQSSYLYAMARAGRAAEAYKAVPSKESFQVLASNLVFDKKWPELAALVDLHRPLGGADDPELLQAQAHVKLAAKDRPAAEALFQKAYQKQTQAPLKEGHTRTFLQHMAERGWALEGYRAAADARLAFGVLANQLKVLEKDQELEKLIEEHARKHADDPALVFQRGELHLKRGELAQAEKAYRDALTQGGRADQWSFRNGLLKARVRSGQTVRTYEEEGAGTRVFEELANLCVAEKNPKELEALLAAHRKAHPRSGAAAAWDLDLKYLNQKYEDLVRALNEERKKTLHGRHRWRMENYLVRSLVHLKRTKEAVQEAEQVAQSLGNRLLLVLAHAAAGDVKQTIAVVEADRSERYLAEDAYRDPDLGPILRSEPFRAFRDRFPEVKRPL